jgi:hypothetical protein
MGNEDLKNLKLVVENIYYYLTLENFTKQKPSFICGVVIGIFLLKKPELERLERIIKLIDFKNKRIEEIDFQKEVDKLSLEIFEKSLENLRETGAINKEFYNEADEVGSLLAHYLHTY